MSERGAIIAGVAVGSLILLVFGIALVVGQRGRGRPAAGAAAGRGERPRYSLDKLPPELAGRAGDIRRLAAPCVRLRAVPADAGLPAWASKFGGAPYLAAGSQWPKSPDGKPLTFIGQLNFGEIAEALRAAGATPPPDLPAKGLLMFFYDMEKSPWGGEPGDQNHWRAIWEPEVTPGRPTAAVPPQKDPPKPCRLVASAGISLPGTDDEVCPPPGLNDAQLEAYDSLREDLSAGPGHQLLGHASTIQNDPRSTVAGAAAGSRPAGKIAPGELARWRLLWQIDSDDAAGFMWGDSGMIYLMIRDDDLKRGNLGKPGLELQCY